MSIRIKKYKQYNITQYNTMKKYVTVTKTILPLFVVVGMVGALQAQSVSNTMTGTAQLVNNITINPGSGDSASVDFGQVLTNITSAIFLDPKDPANSSTNVGASASIGIFKVGGSPGTSVTVDYTTNVPMAGTSGNPYVLNWVPKVTFDQSNPVSQSGSADLADGTQINLNANDLHLFIGGNLVDASGDIDDPFSGGTPTPDTYSGDITIEITIN